MLPSYNPRSKRQAQYTVMHDFPDHYCSWQVPEGNLLQVYLGACERRCSVANSGVASQVGYMKGWPMICQASQFDPN